MKMKQCIQMFKPLSIAILLGLSSANLAAAEMVDSESSMVNTAPEVYDNAGWQSPAVVEFNKLDTSGNGLLLPKEASKGKAFNKKTFAQADTDKDGTIDQNEYVFFKTGKMPEAAKPAMAAPATEPMPDKAMPETMPDKTMPDPADMKDTPMSEESP